MKAHSLDSYVHKVDTLGLDTASKDFKKQVQILYPCNKRIVTSIDIVPNFLTQLKTIQESKIADKILDAFDFEPFNYISLKTEILKSIQSNIYLQQSEDSWLELLNLVLRNNRGFMSYLRHSKTQLRDWVFSQLEKYVLDKRILSKDARLTTKVYWFLTGLVEMPYCKQCGTQLDFRNTKSIQHSTYDFCSFSCTTNYYLKDIQATSISKYGNAWNQDACRATWKRNYGPNIVNPMQIHRVQIKQKRKYFCDGLHFDSGAEVSFYTWLKDSIIDFEVHPQNSFEYEFNGKLHRYFPDFKVGDIFFEIKGDHFFSSDGKMICPFRPKDWSDERYQEECAKYEAKHQCMLANNVVILTSSMYCIFELYVKSKYGDHWIEQFRQ